MHHSYNKTDFLELESNINWKKWISTSRSAFSSLVATSIIHQVILHRKKILLILMLSVAGLNGTINSRGWKQRNIKMHKKREGHGAVQISLHPSRILLTGRRNDGGFHVLDSVEIIGISKSRYNINNDKKDNNTQDGIST
mmetsp:Transcript_18817/g.28184  ORF Transcript_18817/g.28184 Transcript_18817/m.28184 type:complete len:140 (+) Transcript_18817:222-641(+)